MGLELTAMQILNLAITAASVAYQINQQKRMKREADKRKGFAINKRGESAHVPIVYGKQMVGLIEANHKVRSSYTYAAPGALGKEFNSKDNKLTSNISGTKNQILLMNGAFAQGGISDVVSIQVDDQIFDVDKDHSHIIHTYLDELSASSPLGLANDLGNDHLFKDFANLTAAFNLNRDEYNYNGIPAVSLFVKGRKVRTINSSYQLSSTYTYSNNPAYVLLDYLMLPEGRNLTPGEIDLESFYKAAQICEQIKTTNKIYGGAVNGQKGIQDFNSVSEFPATDSNEPSESIIYHALDTDVFYSFTSTGTEENPAGNYTVTNLPRRDIPLYECNIALDSEAKIRDNVEAILNTMPLAVLTWTSEGKYKLLLEYPESQSELEALTVATFNDDNVIRDSVNLSWLPATERYNQVTCTYLNEHENFKEDSVTWPPYSSETSSPYQIYLAEDNNQPMTTSLNLEGITDPYHALAAAEQITRQSRTFHTVEFRANKEALKLEPGDFINLDISNAKVNGVYRINSIEISEDLTVNISAYFVDVNSFAWNVNDDVGYSSDEGGVSFTATPPTNLVFTENAVEYFSVVHGTLTWTAANDVNVVGYRVDASNDGGLSWFNLGTTSDTKWEVTGLQTGTYKFGVRSITNTNRVSSRLVTVNTYNLNRLTNDQVIAIYADSDDPLTNNQSYAKGTFEFAAYYTYNGDIPTLPVRENITFTRIEAISIDSVSKTNDIVTVSYSDGTNDTFTVNGVSQVQKVDDTLTLTFDNGTTTTIVDGDPGIDGNGIASIVKEGEIVTITYDDATTATFTIKNPIYGDPDPVTTFSLSRNAALQWSANYLDVDFTFRQSDGTIEAKRRYRIIRSGETWSEALPRDADITDELNVTRLTPTLNVVGTSATLTVEYNHNGITAKASAQVDLILQGIIGEDATSIAELTLYTRSNNQPNAPSSSSWQFDFATSSLTETGASTGWYAQIPIGTAPVWVTQGTASVVGTAGIDSSITWSTPVKAFENGSVTFNGFLYYQTLQSTAPTFSPAGIGWNIAGSTFTGLPANGWDITKPSLSSTHQSNHLEWTVLYKVIVNADDTVSISFGSVTGAQIFETRIQSDNYSPGSSGWMIDRDAGSAEFGAAAIRDQLIVGTNVGYPALGIPTTEINGLATVATSGDYGDLANTPDIQSIQTTLGAKTTVYYQPTEPSSTTYDLSNNDLWYDTDDNNRLYIYVSASSSWQPVSIVADSVVTGWLGAQEIAANQINAQNLSSVSSTTGSLTVNNVLRLSGGAGFIANRSSASDYATPGFYIGQAGSNNFEFSHMSTNNSNQLSGIVNSSDGTGLQIFNPTFYAGGSSAGGQSSMTSSGSYNVGDVDSFTLTLVGGGGGGGYGLGDGYVTNGSRAGSGGTTSAFVYRGGSFVGSFTASGGIGGLNANSESRSGEKGEDYSIYGTGGSGGAPNSNGGNGIGYGAGGGGAGGDDSSIFDSSGGSGGGGSAGQTNSVTVDCSAYTGNVGIVFTQGGGGAGGNSTYDGGDGAPGIGFFSSPLGGTTQITLSELLESGTLGQETGQFAYNMFGTATSFNLPVGTGKWIIVATYNSSSDNSGGYLTLPENITGGFTITSTSAFNYSINSLTYYGAQNRWAKFTASSSPSMVFNNQVQLAGTNSQAYSMSWIGVIYTEQPITIGRSGQVIRTWAFSA